MEILRHAKENTTKSANLFAYLKTGVTLVFMQSADDSQAEDESETETKHMIMNTPNYIPSCIDELNWTPFEEDGVWYNQWSGLGCEDGEILDVGCDVDGNWDIEGSGYDDTPENWERMNEELLRDSERAEKNYYDFCRETGTDPLHALYIERTKTVCEHWVALFTSWIGASTHGLAVTQVGRGRKTCLDPQQAPKHVRDYLGLVKVGDRWCMDGVHNAKDMFNAGYVGNGYVKFTVERKVPVSAKKIAEQVRRVLAK